MMLCDFFPRNPFREIFHNMESTEAPSKRRRYGIRAYGDGKEIVFGSWSKVHAAFLALLETNKIR